MQAAEAAIHAAIPVWEHARVAAGVRRELMGAVDATFLPRRRLVCIDLVSGSLSVAEGAAKRPYASGLAWLRCRDWWVVPGQ